MKICLNVRNEMMNYRLFTSAVFAAIFALCVSVSAQESVTAQVPANDSNPGDDVVKRYPSGSIQTVEQADQALIDVKQQRARLNEQFAQEDAACYSRFFVTACTDEVKERQRLALGQLNPIEVEANAFKRRARVAERDKALAGQQAKEASKAVNRADSKGVNPTGSRGDFQGSPIPSKDDVDKMEKKASESNKSGSAPFMKTNDVREAQHKEKMEKEEAKEASQASRRADNIKDYEKKQQQAQERQRKVAEKKARREQEQNRKIKEAP